MGLFYGGDAFPSKSVVARRTDRDDTLPNDDDLIEAVSSAIGGGVTVAHRPNGETCSRS